MEYNKSTLRVCKKCFDAKESITRTVTTATTVTKHAEDGGSAVGSSSVSSKPSSTKDDHEIVVDENEDEDDEDPDINFEVRPEKLNSFSISHDQTNISLELDDQSRQDDENEDQHEEDPDQLSIYDMQANRRPTCDNDTPHSSSHSHIERKGTVI